MIVVTRGRIRVRPLA